MMRGREAVGRPEISLGMDNVMLQIGKTRAPERMEKIAAGLLTKAANVWRPAFCYSVYKIEAARFDGLALLYGPDGALAAELRIGPRVCLLSNASECFVGATTVGKELCQLVKDIEDTGDALSAYIMDIISVMALHAVHAEFRREVENYAGGVGVKTGPVMQPGSLHGWPIEGQRELFRMFPAEEIGIELNEQCMIIPSKSNTSLIGIGTGYSGAHAGCLCEECGRTKCPWRRTKEYGFM